MPEFGIQFHQTRFWVHHRRNTYGPFDYQWASDLRGIEFMYQGEKFGECCSDEEFAADLSAYRIPLVVCQVATVVLGSIVKAIHEGAGTEKRFRFAKQALLTHGYSKFAEAMIPCSESSRD